MKKIMMSLALAFALFSCNNNAEKGKFTVSGELKNATDQKIYLEELFFSQKDPEVLDTADVKNGKFSLGALAPEEGLYRIRLEKGNAGFIFINDQSAINFSADLNDLSLSGPSFTSAANASMKKFIMAMDSQRTALASLSAKLQELRTSNGSDSIMTIETQNFETLNNNYRNFIIQYIDTTSHPVMALFALGYSRNIDPLQLEKSVGGLSGRFPQHQAVKMIVAQYKQMLVQMKQEEESKKASPQEGVTAPDITMNDVNDKPFSLSSLRGKYVLVDFWASWCGPCRGENPNVVAAYNKFKDKNFTVLGVSLDDNKADWLEAIADDKLTWKHISDLKKWNSAAVPLYSITGIPYNVLISPDGKIIASDLRGDALHSKLTELLK